MIEVDYELGKRIVENCTCQCGAQLTLPWGGTWGINSFVIKCAADPGHDKVVPIKSLTQLWREGEPIPSFIADKIEWKFRREIMEQNEVKALIVKQDADKLSTYVRAKFPQDLTSPQVALDFAKWCIAHRLEPVRDCIPYHGNPYIMMEWVDRQAANDQKFKGYSYIVYGEEKKKALDFDIKDLVVECQADFEGLEKPLVGLGVVTKAEREARTGGEADEVTGKGYRSPVVHLQPQKMVFKRARAAALKQRYHIPAPILEELPYTTVIEGEYSITKPEGGEEIGKAGTTKKSEGGRAPAEALFSPPTAEKAAKTGAPPAELEAEGFRIDLTWLKESQKALKWSDDTLKTFLISQYKVSPQGTPEDVLKRLTREQAEDFVNQINTRVNKQPSLFG